MRHLNYGHINTYSFHFSVVCILYVQRVFIHIINFAV